MFSLKVGTTTARHAIAGRAVYLRVHPRTRNLEEGRQVLRELERFGPVEMFRSLKYDPETNSPNGALAIYQHEFSAQQLLNASPIQYALDPPPTGDHRVYSSMAATCEEENPWLAEGIEEMVDDETTAPLPRYNGPSAADPPLNYRSPWGTTPRTPPASSSRTFSLTASLSHLDHAAYISRQPHYGPYSPMADPVRSAQGLGQGAGRRREEAAREVRGPGLMRVWREGLGEGGAEGEAEGEGRGKGVVRKVEW